MEDRKGEENFQLIVVTHDERFAQLIGQRQHAEITESPRMNSKSTKFYCTEPYW